MSLMEIWTSGYGYYKERQDELDCIGQYLALDVPDLAVFLASIISLD